MGILVNLENIKPTIIQKMKLFYSNYSRIEQTFFHILKPKRYKLYVNPN